MKDLMLDVLEVEDEDEPEMSSSSSNELSSNELSEEEFFDAVDDLEKETFQQINTKPQLKLISKVQQP
jgi:hypothetical protein